MPWRYSTTQTQQTCMSTLCISYIFRLLLRVCVCVMRRTAEFGIARLMTDRQRKIALSRIFEAFWCALSISMRVGGYAGQIQQITIIIIIISSNMPSLMH